MLNDIFYRSELPEDEQHIIAAVEDKYKPVTTLYINFLQLYQGKTDDFIYQCFNEVLLLENKVFWLAFKYMP